MDRNQIAKGETNRRGLHVRGAKVAPEVRESVMRFAKWLRRHVEFEKRVVIYLSHRPRILARDGKLVSATFFGPFDTAEEPYIRVSTGDFQIEKKKQGRDDALAGILASVAHEIVHYTQWLSRRDLHERGVTRRAKQMIRNYATTTRRP